MSTYEKFMVLLTFALLIVSILNIKDKKNTALSFLTGGIYYKLTQ